MSLPSLHRPPLRNHSVASPPLRSRRSASRSRKRGRGRASGSAPGGYGGFSREPPKWATREDFDGAFQFLPRLLQQQPPRGRRTGLAHRLSRRRQQLLRPPRRAVVRPRQDEARRPARQRRRAPDRSAALSAARSSTWRTSARRASATRRSSSFASYLLKGGFLEVDDFWGTQAWEQWAEEIGRVLPPHRYPIFDIPRDHPVMHTLYDVKEVEQVSNIRYLDADRRQRLGARAINDSPHVNFRGIQDEQGRLMVVMAHNTDIPDTWEREGESKEYFDRFSPERLRHRRQHHDLRDDALTADNALTEVVEAEGHLIDSQLMNAMFDTVVRHDAAFDVLEFRIGRTNDEPSFVSMRVTRQGGGGADRGARGTGRARLPRRARRGRAHRRRRSRRLRARGFLLDDEPSDVRAARRRNGCEVDQQRMDAAIVIDERPRDLPQAARDPQGRRDRLRHPRHQDRPRVPGARSPRLRVHDERDLVRAAGRGRRRRGSPR